MGRTRTLPSTGEALNRLVDEQTRWLVCVGNNLNKAIDSYVSQPALVEPIRAGDDDEPDILLVCQLAGWAEWLRDRLASGLYGATIHETWGEAYEAALERA